MTSQDPAQDRPADAPEEELSAEARALIARARRSFAVSMGILLLGFMTIVLVLVYRATRDEGPPPAVSPVSVPAEIALPTGAVVVSAVPAGGTVAITYTIEGEARLRVVDAATGEPVGADTVFVVGE